MCMHIHKRASERAERNRIGNVWNEFSVCICVYPSNATLPSRVYFDVHTYCFLIKTTLFSLFNHQLHFGLVHIDADATFTFLIYFFIFATKIRQTELDSHSLQTWINALSTHCLLSAYPFVSIHPIHFRILHLQIYSCGVHFGTM